MRQSWFHVASTLWGQHLIAIKRDHRPVTLSVRSCFGQPTHTLNFLPCCLDVAFGHPLVIADDMRLSHGTSPSCSVASGSSSSAGSHLHHLGAQLQLDLSDSSSFLCLCLLEIRRCSFTFSGCSSHHCLLLTIVARTCQRLDNHIASYMELPCLHLHLQFGDRSVWHLAHGLIFVFFFFFFFLALWAQRSARC